VLARSGGRRSKAHACRKRARSALGGKGGQARVQVHRRSDNEIKRFIACAKKLATRAHAQREPAASAYILRRFGGGGMQHLSPQVLGWKLLLFGWHKIRNLLSLPNSMDQPSGESVEVNC